MAQTIKLKRSATSGATPTTSQLELGEVAINTYDGKMYIKKNVGGTESIVEITGGSSTLGGLSDVTISSVAADQLLQYNGSEWVNVSIAEASAIMKEYQFTATAGQSTFSGSDDNSETLSYTAGAIQVFLNGIFLDSAVDYTATNGTSVVLSETVDANDYLQVVAFKKKIGDGNVSVDTFTGNNSTTAFTLSVDPGDENNTRVFIDGVYQSKDNYSVSGTTLTFSTPPPTDTAIEIEIGNRVVTLDTLSDLDLPDNVKLRLGTSQDLEIFHDGTRSIINDAGTGDLQFQVGGSAIFDVTTAGIVMEGFPESSYEIKGDIDGGIRFTVQAGEALSKGDVVYISGAAGDNTVVSKAQANSASTMPAFGLVLADIANGGSGQVVTFGNLYGSGAAALDTSTCSIGDSLYVSATTAGAFTKTAPTGESNLVQNIGKVLRVATSNGVIKVGGAGRTNATPNLDDGDIFIGNASNQSVSASLNTKIESYLDGGTSTPTFAGLATTADMTFGDNDKAVFGAGSDLQIYHDSNNSYIKDAGTGNLYINANELRIGNADNSKDYIHGNNGAEVKLYYNNSQKLATTNTGIDVTGTVTADGLTFGSNHRIQGTGILFLGGSSATAFEVGAGSEKMRLTSTGLGIGTQSPGTKLDVTTVANTAGIRVTAPNTTSQSFGATIAAGTNASDYAFNINNAAGAALLRVRGDGNVGIGVSSPTSALDIRGSGNVDIMSKIINTGQTSDGRKTEFLFGKDNGANLSGVLKYVYDTTQADRRIDLVHYGTSNGISILDGGNVGIGTTSPAFITGSGLEVQRDGVATLRLEDTGSSGKALELSIDDATGAIINSGSSGLPMIFKVINSEAMRINTSGNVGIGETSPDSKLHVKDATNISASAAGAGQFRVEGSGYTTSIAMDATRAHIYHNSSLRNLSFGTDESIDMTIKGSNGFVGIGTENPASLLSIQGDGVVSRMDGTANTSRTLLFRSVGTAEGIVQTDGNMHLLQEDAGRYMRFSTANTERMRIDSSGNLLVNGTNATGKLVVDGDANSYTTRFNSSTTTGQAFGTRIRAGTNSSDYALFVENTSASSMFAVRGDGNVGIGTNSPSSPLEVAGGSSYPTTKLSRDGGTAATQGYLTTGFSAIGYSGGTGADSYLVSEHGFGFAVNAGTNALVITDGGNVGIGISSPSAKGHIAYTTAATANRTYGLIVNGDDSGTVGESSSIFLSGLNATTRGASIAAEIQSAGNDHDLIFATSASGATPAERMRIDASGNVGIGTSSPGTKLSVVDTSAQAVQLSLQNSGRDWRIGPNSGVGSSSLVFYDNTASQTRLVIDSSGNVGIGTSSPAYNLDVSKGSAGTAARFTASTDNGRGLSFISSDNGIFLGAIWTRDVASGSGIHAWSINSTERMRIDSSGNLLVATTNTLPQTATDGGGLCYAANSSLRIGRESNGTGQPILDLNNTGSDDELIRLRKDGTVVGSIGSYLGGYTYIGSTGGTDTHIGFVNGTVRPATATGATLDATLDLGNSSARWKDLYLSGSAKLVADSAASAEIQLKQTGTGGRDYRISSTGSGYGSAGALIFYDATASNERARFDSSGNLLVGKTNNTLSNDGTIIRAGGEILVTNTSDIVANFNRTGTDGSIVTLYKDGTTVGSIGTSGGSAYIGGYQNAGLYFNGTSDVRPWNTSTQANLDNSVDLGNSSSRFKDLHLSGDVIAPNIVASNGVFLGGTSNANKLDDYEEGTWTPTIVGHTGASGQSYSIQNGQYTKIGSFVHCTFDVQLSAVGTLSGTYVNIGGLPFGGAGSNLGGTANIGYYSGFDGNTDHPIGAYISGSKVYLMEMGSSGSNYILISDNRVGSSSRIIGSILIWTDS